jgi:hypothetical protein
LSRGDLMEVEWRILRVLLPVERKPGKRGRDRVQRPVGGCRSKHNGRQLAGARHLRVRSVAGGFSTTATRSGGLDPPAGPSLSTVTRLAGIHH